jgi:[ribosomal protein S5]-alanine N-acetyltransferase
VIEKVKLETERLTLVPFKEEFLNDFYEYAKVPGVGECAGWPHHKSIEESKKILDIFIRDNQNGSLRESKYF